MHKRKMVCCIFFIMCIFMQSALAETGTVTASALVLRAGPGLTYDMLGELPQGTELTILSDHEGWYYIEYDGQKGYVHARYVRIALPDQAPIYTEPPATAAPWANATLPPDLTLPQLTFTGENNPNYPRVMKPGDMGNSVIDLQVTLQGFGYAVSQDGQYGYDTQAAVMRLQREMGIDADGLVGAQTRRLIGGDGSGNVEKLDWWLGGNVAYARLTEATVIDVRTGVRFQIHRYGGDNHCDVEPLTAKDAAAFLSILGGEWSWERRPIWLEVGGRVIAASMNCMPHEGQHITGNDFDGHFCIHFYNSRTHDTNRIDEEHAACVEEAWTRREDYSP